MTNEENQQTSEDNGAENVDINESTQSEDRQDNGQEEDPTDYKAEAAKYKRLFEKAQKGGDKQESTTSESKETTSNSTEFGYGEKAYLNSLGYTDSADHDLVQEAMAETGKTLEQVMASKYIVADIKEAQEDRKTQAATETKGNTRRTQSSSKTEVDYWIKKGELPEETALRRKVIHKRAELAKNASGRGKFNN